MVVERWRDGGEMVRRRICGGIVEGRKEEVIYLVVWC